MEESLSKNGVSNHLQLQANAIKNVTNTRADSDREHSQHKQSKISNSYPNNVIGTVNGIPITKCKTIGKKSNYEDNDKGKFKQNENTNAKVTDEYKEKLQDADSNSFNSPANENHSEVHPNRTYILPLYHSVTSNLIPPPTGGNENAGDERQKELYDFIIKLHKQGSEIVNLSTYKKLQEEKNLITNDQPTYKSLSMLELKKQVDEINQALRFPSSQFLPEQNIRDPAELDLDVDLDQKLKLDKASHTDDYDDYSEWILLTSNELKKGDEEEADAMGRVTIGHKWQRGLVYGSAKRFNRCSIM